MYVGNCERVYYNPTHTACLGELYAVLGKKNTLREGEVNVMRDA